MVAPTHDPPSFHPLPCLDKELPKYHMARLARAWSSWSSAGGSRGLDAAETRAFRTIGRAPEGAEPPAPAWSSWSSCLVFMVHMFQYSVHRHAPHVHDHWLFSPLMLRKELLLHINRKPVPMVNPLPGALAAWLFRVALGLPVPPAAPMKRRCGIRRDSEHPRWPCRVGTRVIVA